MRKYFVFVFISIAIVLLVSSVSADNWLFNKNTIKGSRDLITQDREIDDFTKIKTTGSYDVVVKVGLKTSLKITFDDNLIDLITTEVKGKTLYIESEKSFSTLSECEIEITVQSLTYLKLSGSGDVEIYDLKGDFFEANISGSGNILLSGEVDELELNISGSGDIDSRELKATDAYAKISGSGDIKIYVTGQFDAKVSGSGDIYYYGNPEHVSKKVSGSGDIRKKR